jgi:hypothetical protein
MNKVQGTGEKAKTGRVLNETLRMEKHVQGDWERLVLSASQAQVQSANYGGPLGPELERLRAEGWKLTYSLRNDTGRNYYFKRPLASVPRRFRETAMW